MSLQRADRRRRSAPTLLATLVLGAAFASVAAAQSTARGSSPGSDLARIDSLVANGQIAEARIALDRWNAQHPRNDAAVSGNDRALAFVLSGRLARTWAEAEAAYVAVALGYPITPAAPEAMLRLGQGLLASPASPTGAARAVAYLERLISDYPNSPLRPLGFVWLARAYTAAGRRDAACARIRQAATIQADSTTSRLITTEQARTCGRA